MSLLTPGQLTFVRTTILTFLLMTLGVLALLSAELANNAPPPEATSDGSSVGGLIILVATSVNSSTSCSCWRAWQIFGGVTGECR